MPVFYVVRVLLQYGFQFVQVLNDSSAQFVCLVLTPVAKAGSAFHAQLAFANQLLEVGGWALATFKVEQYS